MTSKQLIPHQLRLLQLVKVSHLQLKTCYRLTSRYQELITQMKSLLPWSQSSILSNMSILIWIKSKWPSWMHGKNNALKTPISIFQIKMRWPVLSQPWHNNQLMTNPRLKLPLRCHYLTISILWVPMWKTLIMEMPVLCAKSADISLKSTSLDPSTVQLQALVPMMLRVQEPSRKCTLQLV